MIGSHWRQGERTKSSTLFSFEEIRTEMDYIRGKRTDGGKVSIKKFIDGLMLEADREI